MPYNINVLTQFSAAFALEHHAILDQQTEQICQDRELLVDALSQFAGLTQYPSAANFILFKADDMSSETIFTGLKQSGVLIKRFADTSGPLADCLRVTVGTGDENQAFINALGKILI